MTEPREPDRNQQEQAGASRREQAVSDWRGTWYQAADGTWQRDTSRAEPSRDDERRDDRPDVQRDVERAGERDIEPDAEQGAASPERTEGQRPAAAKGKRPRSTWKTVGFVAVAGLLLAALVRAVIGAGSHTTSTATGPLPVPARPQTVQMGGAQVPVGGPVLTLNPGLVRQGANVGITGAGFDPGSTVDLQFTPQGSNRPIPIPGVTVARDGSFATGFLVPQLPNADGGTITADQRGTNKGAQADAVVQAGVGSVGLNRVAGKPGDVLSVSGSGFEPGEKINAFWGRVGGPPAEQLQADRSGGISQAPLRVGVAPVGNNTLILVGDHSKTTATAAFTMIGLYPSATVSPYAVKAAQPFTISGSGFSPGERVQLYVGRPGGPPVSVLQSNDRGDAGGPTFVAPFQLRGRQMLTMVGEQSRAVATSGFMIMPYTPQAQPSTWGGMPGTSLSFYASGFAPNEVVLVYAGRGQGSPGSVVSAFRADAYGNASAAGNYTIPGDAQNEASVQLVGRQSGGVANVTLSVEAGGDTADVPTQPPYVLPPDLQGDPLTPGGPPPPPPAPPAPPPGAPHGAPPAPGPH
jgi:hypothetical protein